MLDLLQFEEIYGVLFVDVRKAGIVNFMMFINFLAANSIATYLRHIIVGNMINKHNDVLPQLTVPVREALAGRTLNTIHLHYSRLHILPRDDILFMVQTTNVYIEGYNNPYLFHTNPIYIHTRGDLNKLYARHLKQGKEPFPTRALIFKENIQQKKYPTRFCLSSLLLCVRLTATEVTGHKVGRRGPRHSENFFC